MVTQRVNCMFREFYSLHRCPVTLCGFVRRGHTNATALNGQGTAKPNTVWYEQHIQLACVCVVWCGVNILGVSRITEVTIREQMMRMTSRAMAIPFQFLCGGALPTRS